MTKVSRRRHNASRHALLRLNLLSAAVLMLAGQTTFAASTTDRQVAIDRALSHIQANPSAFKLPAESMSSSARMLLRSDARSSITGATTTPSGDQFEVRDVIIDADGTEHVRFDRFYNGLRVVGGDLITRSSGNTFEGANLALKSAARPSLKAKLTATRAISLARIQFPGTATDAKNEGLVIFARDGNPRLSYMIRVTGLRDDGAPFGALTYYLDAATGTLLGMDDEVFTAAATGTGKTLTAGNVSITTDSVAGGFRMVDPARGNGAVYDAQNAAVNNSGYFDKSRAAIFTDTDNTWGNNTTSDRATVGADIHYGVSATWDYFKEVHGRNGIFNDGRGVNSYAHVGVNYVNAFWLGGNTRTMNYGDGNPSQGYLPLVAIDVAGHEMSHGVNEATANLGYYLIKDSGGINESSSDILGTLVEFYANNPANPGNYLIGEKVYTNQSSTKAMRVMFKQDVDGSSFSCYPQGGFTASQTGQGGRYDPHRTSGVGNRFFYLLAEGSVVPTDFANKYQPKDLVCNGNTNLVGIGREKAGKIWYRALTTQFVSNTDYPGARTGTLKAAADLYGENSTEWRAVASAWAAVLVGSDPAPPTNTPPVANFTASVNGLTATFTNSSSDADGTITAYAWNFGDGATASTVSPSHTYAASGTYTVTLKVTDNKGASHTKTQSVTVSGGTNPPANVAPVADFSSAVSGLTASFTNRSTDPDGTITAYAWNFGDGSTSSTANPSHTYTAAGTYTVSLKVTDNKGATNTKSQSISVTKPAGGGNVFSNTTPLYIGPNTTVISGIAVSGRPGNGSARLKISANITHNMSGNLQVTIIAPNGSSALLKNIDLTTPGSLNASWYVDASQVAANGTWKLMITDYDIFGRGDRGTLNNWSLTF